MKTLIEDVETFCRDLKDKEYLNMCAGSLEICPREWSRTGEVKLHLHVFWSAPQCKSVFNDDHSPFFFKGSRPHFPGSLGNDAFEVNHAGHIRMNSDNRRNRKSKKGATKIAMYYLTCPKIGKVFSWSSHKAFEDFTVPPSVITNLVALQKMHVDHAKAEFVKTATDVKKYLDNLDFIA